MSFYLYSISTGFYIKSGGYVGILNSNPQYPLDVSGDCRITGQTLFGVRPTVNGSGVLLQGEVTQGSNVVTHLLGRNDTVDDSIMTFSTRNYSYGAVSVIGTDLAGYIQISVGSSELDSNLILDVNFKTPFANIPYVLISPASNAAALMQGVSCFCNRNPNFTDVNGKAAFTLTSSSPLQPNNVYLWNYAVIGYQG